MKKLSAAMVVVFILLIFASCTQKTETPETLDATQVKQTEVKTDKHYDYIEVDGIEIMYRDENIFDIEEYTSTYDGAVIPNAETAVRVTWEIFKGLNLRETEAFEPIFVTNDEEKGFWIVTFADIYDEETGEYRVGGGYSIAIRKSDGKVLKIWLGE